MNSLRILFVASALAVAATFVGCGHGPLIKSDETDARTADQKHRALIKVAIDEHSAYAGDCAKTVVLAKRPVDGKVTLEWDLNVQGRVTKATVVKSRTNVRNEKLVECLLTSFKGWIFPTEPNTETTISFPFEFEGLNDFHGDVSEIQVFS